MFPTQYNVFSSYEDPSAHQWIFTPLNFAGRSCYSYFISTTELIGFRCSVQTHTRTQTHTCRATTILTLPAAQLVSASASRLSVDGVNNAGWTRCGAGVGFSKPASRHGCRPPPCKSDTRSIRHAQLTDLTQCLCGEGNAVNQQLTRRSPSLTRFGVRRKCCKA